MTDINAKGKSGIDLEIRQDGRVLWINAPDECLVRICQIKGKIRIIDRRKAKKK